MSRAAGSRWAQRTTVALLALSLLFPASLLPVALAQQPATLQGVILDPTGRPAANFKVVFKDVVTGTEYTSTASNAAGEYSLQVPTGARYQLTSAMAPDGTRLPIQAGSPLPVRTPGTYRRDVQFQEVGARAVEPPAETKAAEKPKPTVAEKPKPKPEPEVAQKPKPATKAAPASQARSIAKKPWWKTTGGVIGIVVGSVAVLGIALSGGGSSSTPASPSNP